MPVKEDLLKLEHIHMDAVVFHRLDSAWCTPVNRQKFLIHR